MGSVGDSPWKIRPVAVALRAAHSVGTTWDAQPGAVVRGHHVGPSPVTAIASTTAATTSRMPAATCPAASPGVSPRTMLRLPRRRLGATRAPPRGEPGEDAGDDQGQHVVGAHVGALGRR